MALRSVRTAGVGPSGFHVGEARVNGGAMVSGAFLTLGTTIFLMFLGNAVGLNVANTVRTDISGVLKFFSWLYMAVSIIFSYYVGGYFSSRLSQIDSRSSGVVHGLTSWALSTFLFVGIAVIASIGMRILMAGLASNPANWLAVVSIGLGAVAAASGGMRGRYSRSAVTPTTEEEGITGRRVA